MTPGKSALLVATSVLLAAAPAYAEDPTGQLLGGRSLATGGTGLADPNNTAGAIDNVAALSLGDRYEVVASAGLGPWSQLMLRGAAVDTRTAPVTLGAGYYHLSDDIPPAGDELPGWRPEGTDLTDATEHQGVFLAAAYPFLDRRMSVGLTARYDWRVSEQLGDEGAFNLGAGIAGRPVDQLTMQVGVRNVFDWGYPDTERTVDFSLRWEPGTFLALEGEVGTEVDGTPIVDALDYAAGAQVGVVEWLGLRAGFQWTDAHPYVSGGLGLLSKQISVDYGLAWQADSEELHLWHAADLRVTF